MLKTSFESAPHDREGVKMANFSMDFEVKGPVPFVQQKTTYLLGRCNGNDARVAQSNLLHNVRGS